MWQSVNTGCLVSSGVSVNVWMETRAGREKGGDRWREEKKERKKWWERRDWQSSSLDENASEREKAGGLSARGRESDEMKNFRGETRHVVSVAHLLLPDRLVAL
jgi:hypothetical protein